MMKKTKRKTGYWLVTPVKGASRRFETTKLMVAYARKMPGCMISYIRQ